MAGFEGGSEVINNGTVIQERGQLPRPSAQPFRVSTRWVVRSRPRLVPLPSASCRPSGRTANPDADIAHQAVDDPDTVDPHASALLSPRRPWARAQAQTTGNPQSAPSRSERVYKKDNDPSEQARYKAALDDPEVMREFGP